MSAAQRPPRPGLILCAAADSGVDAFSSEIFRHPSVSPLPPDVVERLEAPQNTLMVDGEHFDLAPAPADEAFSRALERRQAGETIYLAWQPERFVEWAHVQWALLRHLPAARYLFCLRDPVEVAYARFLAHREEMPAGIDEAIDHCEVEMADIGRWETRGKWPGYFAHPSAVSLLLEGGAYWASVSRAQRLAGHERVHCVIYERFLADPEGTLSGVWDFFGLPAGESTGVAMDAAGDGAEPLSGAARARLGDLYAGLNGKLSQTLGKPLDDWG